MNRIRTLIAAMVLLAVLLPVNSAAGASATVSGQLVAQEASDLSTDAVAVILLVDQDASDAAGAIVGQQRIDGAQLPTDFEVPYDTADINPGSSYALVASIVDGTTTYESIEPVPVITGGPTSDVLVTMAEEPPQPAIIDVSIVRTDSSALTAGAYAIAALLREDTGTMVEWTVVPAIDTEPIDAPIGYDPGILDPTAAYVVRAGIIDGDQHWSGPAVPAISGGATTGTVEVTVSPEISPPTPSESLTPSESPEPSATAEPSTPPEPSAPPDEGVIKGTLTYREDHDLGATSRAIVALVQGSAGPLAGKVVAVDYLEDTGPEPVPYEISYAWDDVNPGRKYYLWAGIVDGNLAWTTPVGVRVQVPQPLLTRVELPLQFRADLLKAAVSGTVDGIDLDTSDPSAFATVSIVRLDTGETIGFQVIAPAGPAPVRFSVPYDRSKINNGEAYVALALVNDGTERWESEAGTPVITQGSPVSKVDLEVVPAAAPSPSPSASESPTPSPTATATVSPSPSPAPDSGGGVEPGLVLLLALMVAAGAGVAFFVARDRRNGGDTAS